MMRLKKNFIMIDNDNKDIMVDDENKEIDGDNDVDNENEELGWNSKNNTVASSNKGMQLYDQFYDVKLAEPFCCVALMARYNPINH